MCVLPLFRATIKRTFAAMAAITLVAFSGVAQADAWPSKPVRFVVCFPPGNAADVFARAVAPFLAQKIGQPVVVENRAGASGIIGIEAVVRAEPDGYTIGVCSLSPITILPAVRHNIPYDVERDLTPVLLSNKGPMVLVVKKDSPINSLQDLIQYSTANPGKLSYASLGPGTISQMSTEAFKMASGANLFEVGYKGSGAALTDLMGGHVDVMLDGAASASTQIAANTVKALAVTTQKRSPLLPDVPAMSESDLSGLKDFDFFGWVGFFAPAGTPPEIVARLNKDIAEALKTPLVQERAQATGQEIVDANTPEEFHNFIQADFVRWSNIAKQLNLKIDG